MRLFLKMTARWIGLGGSQSIVEAEQGRAVRAEAAVFHREIDVGMVMRRQYADAVEFTNTDADLAYRKLIVEL